MLALLARICGLTGGEAAATATAAAAAAAVRWAGKSMAGIPLNAVCRCIVRYSSPHLLRDHWNYWLLYSPSSSGRRYLYPYINTHSPQPVTHGSQRWKMSFSSDAVAGQATLPRRSQVRTGKTKRLDCSVLAHQVHKFRRHG